MNIQEATIEMEKLMEGKTFCCEHVIWNKGSANGGCIIFFDFEKGMDLIKVKRDTFDECIERVKTILKVRNLLLKKF